VRGQDQVGAFGNRLFRHEARIFEDVQRHPGCLRGHGQPVIDGGRGYAGKFDTFFFAQCFEHLGAECARTDQGQFQFHVELPSSMVQAAGGRAAASGGQPCMLLSLILYRKFALRRAEGYQK